MRIVLGLGNPGEEYENTRHNVGAMAVIAFCKAQEIETFENDKTTGSLKAEGKIGKSKTLFLLPQTYMNNSGKAVKKLVATKKKAAEMVVVHDDIDLPLGTYKVAFGRGSGGHRGVESIIRAVKTKDFTRVRIGIIPTTPGGKLKKPKGEKLLDFLMAEFKADELAALKKVFKKITPSLEDLLCRRPVSK